MTTYKTFSTPAYNVRYSCFGDAEHPAEYHAIIHPVPGVPLDVQLSAINSGEALLRASLGPSVRPVFRRWFLSDPANQAQLLPADDSCAVSVVGQPPLSRNMPKAVLWLYLQEDADICRLPGELTRVKAPDGTVRYWQGTCCVPGADSFEATEKLLSAYSDTLRNLGLSLEADCMRTWFFVRDVDRNYAGLVTARNEVFAREGLTAHSHFIASTGIGAMPPSTDVTVSLDTFAVAGLKKGAVRHLKGSTHLSPTADYGEAFERATAIEFPDRRHVLVSGTASIDNKGEIVHPGDIVRQTTRMCENVEVLLAEAGCTGADMTQAIVYVRDVADGRTVGAMIADRYPGVPFVVVLGPVCRPGWLVEMECMAVR